MSMGCSQSDVMTPNNANENMALPRGWGPSRVALPPSDPRDDFAHEMQ